MNKVVILKFKEEFDYWLKGGSLWYKYGNDKEWKFLEADSSEINHVFNPYNVKILINDELSEFRKALSDGEAVQYYVDGFAGWQDVKSLNQSCMHPTSFRIKPEEPKFKVGDWVRVKTGTFEYDGTARISKGVKQLSKSDMWLFSENHYKCNPDNYIEHWQPKKGEWCWFSIKNRIPTIGQFLSIETDGNRKYSATFPNTPHPFITYYDYCEPFLGQLPSNLQDTK